MKVIASSVIRAAQKREAHGNVYLVDIENGDFEKVIAWDDQTIAFAGNGGERGLRGITFFRDKIYLATSGAIYEYDQRFRQTGIYHNRYLLQCHEICAHNDRIYISSTGWDSLIVFDPLIGEFTDAYRLDIRPRKMPPKKWRAIQFDPNVSNDLARKDEYHFNNVCNSDGRLYLSCADVPALFEFRDGDLSIYAEIPIITHNPMPYKDGVLMNYTRQDVIAYCDRSGKILKTFKAKAFDENEMENSDIDDDIARQGFTRGLCIQGDTIIGGSSPANVSIYHFNEGKEPLTTIVLSCDIRNAVHGLEIWPYD